MTIKHIKRCVLCMLIIVFSGSLFSQEYQKPKLSDSNSWSLVLLPDVQSYVKFGRNQPILDLMTMWIAENIDTLNIGMVMATGDLVEDNEIVATHPRTMNQPAKSQWEAVARSFSNIDGRVPYITCTGNHDYSYGDNRKKCSQFYKYFPIEKNFLNQKILKHTAPNTEGFPTLENAAYEFKDPYGQKYLFVSIEFAPRNSVIDWAKKLLDKPEYKDYRVILLTHSYINSASKHIVKEGYPIDIAENNYGENIWKKLVQPSVNIEMVVCGHIASPHDFTKHVGFRTDKNAAGKSVHQMLFNAQALGGGWFGNGGDGWLRILEFLPDGKTVKVKTFSPLFAISPTTQQYAWETSDYNEFTFVFD